MKAVQPELPTVCTRVMVALAGRGQPGTPQATARATTTGRPIHWRPLLSMMSDTDQLERFAITAESKSESKTVVQARDQEFVIDEPSAMGGTNNGATPVEYLIGSWAGCLNVVTHTVAEEHDIEIDGIDFEITGDLDPRKFLQGVEDVRAGYQTVDVEITIAADADEATLQDLTAEVEERCPVGDTIANPTPTSVTVDTA